MSEHQQSVVAIVLVMVLSPQVTVFCDLILLGQKIQDTAQTQPHPMTQLLTVCIWSMHIETSMYLAASVPVHGAPNLFGNVLISITVTAV